ncbi:hypothetical protein ACGRHY_02465 [Streptomyces sp. HK10]|uniref:hypothetical protein n=1 Tax=Streptomyces sp. HK10 TaxID=3373255 RepID=UPI00374A4F89
MALQAGRRSLKETIVLNTPAAPREWTFPLTLDGLTPELGPNGAVLLKDAVRSGRKYWTR